MTRLDKISFATLCFLLACQLPGVALGQETDDCLACHDDEELTKNRDGRVVSLHIDIDTYEGSIHGENGLECIDCHADLDGFDDWPHEDDLQPVDCAECHDDIAEIYSHSLHGRAVAEGAQLAPRCWSCHGAHDILPADQPGSQVDRFNIPFMCGRCHKEDTPVSEFYDIPQDSILTHYSLSIHGEGLYQRGLTISAVCIDCHTAHNVRDHTDPASTIHRDNVATTCEQCHGRIEEVHRKVIRGNLWEEEPDKVPVCIECHQPHEVRRVFYAEGMSNQECLACHRERDLTAVHDDGERSLFVDAEQLHGSAHQGIACIQCHTGASPVHDRPCDTVTATIDCSICHAEVVATFETGTHGQLHQRGDPDAPTCQDCHGQHGVLPRQDSDSPTSPRNVSTLCGRCHGPDGVADLRHPHTGTNMVENYQLSVHGRALEKGGLVVSATCTDCHTAHHMLPPENLDSSINRTKITETCSQCHVGIAETFAQSIHFTGEPHGDHHLPLCNDCHSSHEIVRTDAAGFIRQIVSSCGGCHEEDTQAYFETYHGKVFTLGATATANCHDCHGSHEILPPTDPRSTLSRENVVETCAQCHTGAHRQFAGYLTHATHHDKDKYPFLYWTWLFMTALLVGTFGFFGLHTLLWMPRSFQAMKHGKELRKKSGGVEIRRFAALSRQLHILVIVSFLGLAVTGMTLKFSYLPWAQWLAGVLGGFRAAGTIHRLCALITFYYFGRHIVDVIYRKRHTGVSWKEFITGPSGLMFNATDGREFIQTLKWFIGMGPRPRYGRWTYWEKFDYFAVFWGVGMIGLSGLVLWFPVFFTRFLPGAFVNVATIIHSDEALLATGFIFTVHFFNTHFRPDRFPMDPVIFTGRIPIEEFKADRPREYEEMVAANELEKHIAPPLHPMLIRAMRIFGFTALTIGLSLILLIIGTYLFGYR